MPWCDALPLIPAIACIERRTWRPYPGNACPNDVDKRLLPLLLAIVSLLAAQLLHAVHEHEKAEQHIDLALFQVLPGMMRLKVQFVVGDAQGAATQPMLSL